MERGAFVGRERELGAIASAISSALDGNGSCLLVSGEPGIGKTRLVEEAMAKARATGFLVLRGSCSAEGNTPYEPFAKALGAELFEDAATSRFSFVIAIGADGGNIVRAGTGQEAASGGFPEMLVAVQDFTRDSFGGGDGSLGRLEYGGSKVIIERAGSTTVAAVFDGDEHPEMRALVKEAASRISADPSASPGELESLALARFAVRATLEGARLENERIRMANGLLERVRSLCGDGPLLLALEDLHWADGSTLHALRFMARALAGTRALVLGTARHSEGGAARTCFDGMRGDGTLSDVDLPGLDAAGVRALVDSACSPNDIPAEFAVRLHRDCAGNPFFVGELLRQMLADSAIAAAGGRFSLARADYAMPATIDDLVQRRLASLDPEAMAVAEYASCIGREFLLEVALTAPNTSDARASISRLAAAGIITSEYGSGSFTHALFQVAAYGSIAPRWRAAHHKAIGESMERAFAGREDEAAYDLARHFSLSTEHAKALRHCISASEKAERAYAAEQALGFLSKALSALRRLGRSGGAEESRLCYKSGELCSLLGKGAESAEFFERASSLSGGDAGMWARSRRRLADILERTGKYAEALAELDAIDARLGESHPIERGGSLVSRSFVQIRKSDFAAAVATSARAYDMLKGIDNFDAKREAVNALNNIATAHLSMGDFQNAKRMFASALGLREAMGDELGVCGALNNLSNACASMGEREEALGYLARANEIAERHGDVRTVGIVSMNIGNLHAEQGKYDLAEGYYRKALAYRRRVGDPRGIAVALNNFGVVQMERGDLEGALATYDESHTIRSRIGDRAGAALTLRNAGCVRLEMGDPRGAREILARAAAESEAVGDKKHAAFSLCWLAEAQLGLGDVAGAEGSCAKAESFASGSNIRDTVETARMVRARILAAKGLHAEAVALFREAIAAFDEMSMPSEAAKTRYRLAEALFESGDAPGARAELSLAAEGFQILGSALWSKRCEAALAKVSI